MKQLLNIVVLSLLLSACASVSKPRPAEFSPELQALWSERQATLASLDQWEITGRMAVRTDDDGGSANFVWERRSDEHNIEMFGPFGSGRVTITQSGDGAVLRDGDDPPVSAASAEELLYYQVGWHVPFESLKFWLKGVPSPTPHDTLVLDAEGRALGFRQDGWEVSIPDYSPGDPVSVPRRVFIKALPGTVHLIGEQGEDLGDRLDVRVVMRRWQAMPG
jgi:outer membrane lipoprotein LolB